VQLCVAHFRDSTTIPMGVPPAEWQQAIVSLAQFCFAQQRLEDALLVAGQLLGSLPASMQLPRQLLRPVLLACLQLEEWEEGAAFARRVKAAELQGEGVEVREAYWALQDNPNQGLNRLLGLVEEKGWGVGVQAVKGLLAQCEAGVCCHARLIGQHCSVIVELSCV
jgi:hypothetical protein